MDESLQELVDDWLTKASGDKKAAERLEPSEHEPDYDPALYGRAAFYWQQAAEKTLKAYLSARSIVFGKTHDLERLVSLAASIEDGFNPLGDAAATLAPFAVEIRYPGDWDELSRDEYDEAKDAAREIIAFATQRIDQESDTGTQAD